MRPQQRGKGVSRVVRLVVAHLQRVLVEFLRLVLAEVGVQGGALLPLTASGQWPRMADVSPNEDLDLILCEGNWKHAEEHPDIVQSLIEQEIEAGFVVRTDLTEGERRAPDDQLLECARRGEGPTPGGGQLHLKRESAMHATREGGAASRLRCQARPHAGRPGRRLHGCKLRLQGRRKQIQVRPEEHGLLLFAHQGVLYQYRVCHFGGRFSAYWWQRFSALLLRQIHALLGSSPHRAWLYVDDLLAQLDQLLLLVIYFQAILAPMSWKKAQFGDAISWCGWDFHFDVDIVALTAAKLRKLRDQLKELCEGQKVSRQLLQQCSDCWSGPQASAHTYAPSWRRYIATSTANRARCTRSTQANGASSWTPSGPT